MKNVHLTIDEVSLMVAFINQAIRENIITPEQVISDEAKSVFYKIKALGKDEHYYLSIGGN
jgi:hypothetical protein